MGRETCPSYGPSHYPDNFVLLGLHATVVMMPCFAVCYLFAVGEWEKKQLLSFVKSKLGKTHEINPSQQEEPGIETL